MNILKWFRRKICSHLFKAADMQSRDSNGIIHWPCSKCNKMFTAAYGLKILENGKCDGKWLDATNPSTQVDKHR